MSYSQEDEERVILERAEGSRFLDIGAYDGKTFSNTRALAEKGWSGVWVEPAAWAFDLAVENHVPGVELIQALIGPTTTLKKFHYTRDAVSTSVQSFAEVWEGTVRYTPIYAMQLSVDELLTRFPGPYHFISIDCEGQSTEVLDLLRPHLDTLNTNLICVEREGNPPEIPGFSLIHTNTNNYILRRGA
jgi:FkbM family methyltransferase